jgi:hypothetical protein
MWRVPERSMRRARRCGRGRDDGGMSVGEVEDVVSYETNYTSDERVEGVIRYAHVTDAVFRREFVKRVM